MFKGYGKRLDKYNSLLQRLTSTITQYIKGMNVFKAFNLTAHSFKKYIDIIMMRLIFSGGCYETRKKGS